MAKRENYESRAEAILEPIVAANNCEIYDVEYIKEGSDWYLRAYIDKPEGVNIVDCENVSQKSLIKRILYLMRIFWRCQVPDLEGP